MAKPSKSQWDFGELFPKEATRHVLTVSELTGQVRRALEKGVGRVWVSGEVSNFRAQSSGHIYFSLKDALAQLSCVLFRGESVSNRQALRDGQKVILHGEITVYEPRGQYQLRVTAVELQGVGALQAAFEQLKQKLHAEGLFAADRKRPLPRFAQRIGIVTSPDGAAIRDVIHVIERRNPALEIIVAPCRVQGIGAAEEIAAAIRLLNRWSADEASRRLDLILVTRGGGSLQDLWAFNEEIVARAIHASELPVVSAVGHEIDFTISDFVADVRAATPSAAAEVITEGVFASRHFVNDAPLQLGRLLRNRMESARDATNEFGRRLARVHPRRLINENFQRLDDLQSALAREVHHRFERRQQGWSALRGRFARLRPSLALQQHQSALTQQRKQFAERIRVALKHSHHRLDHAASRLRLLSPGNVLERGYSITMDAESGRILRDPVQVKSGQKIRTRLKKGEVSSTVD
ncbi:MAG: exodeoxyribonuclease VII large subunit [Verrucomicrobiota bacterium]